MSNENHTPPAPKSLADQLEDLLAQHQVNKADGSPLERFKGFAVGLAAMLTAKALEENPQALVSAMLAKEDFKIGFPMQHQNNPVTKLLAALQIDLLAVQAELADIRKAARMEPDGSEKTGEVLYDSSVSELKPSGVVGPKLSSNYRPDSKA